MIRARRRVACCCVRGAGAIRSPSGVAPSGLARRGREDEDSLWRGSAQHVDGVRAWGYVAARQYVRVIFCFYGRFFLWFFFFAANAPVDFFRAFMHCPSSITYAENEKLPSLPVLKAWTR